VRGDGRGALLRGKCDASGGVPHLVRSEAARIVRGVDCGGDGRVAFVPRRAVLNLGEIESVGFGTAVGSLRLSATAGRRKRFMCRPGSNGISLPDPVAMAVALDSSIVTSASEHFGMWRRRAS